MADTAQVADDAPIRPRHYPRWPRARILRYVGAALAVVLIIAAGRASALWVENNIGIGCCGQELPSGEIWFCREPDAAHPVGQLFLLRTSQVERRKDADGRLFPYAARLETGHVGTPLLWRQTAGVAVLAVDLAVVPHTNEVVPDETTSVLVREGQLTVVLDRGLAKAGSVCPAPPRSMSTPAS